MAKRARGGTVGRSSRGFRGTLLGVVVAAGLGASCTFDSRWLQQVQAQRAALKNAAPSALQGAEDPDGHPAPAARVMTVRAYATPRHAAEVLKWSHRFEALAGEANRILGPTLRVRLEVASAQAWSVSGDEQSLGALLDELRAQDAGDGADWVIGLASSVPRAEVSFHDLGLATRPGKHIVLRAINDAREREVLLKGITYASEDELQKVFSQRKTHKLTTILLHELAHTLGVIHQREGTSILSPTYSTKAERFDDAAVEWMRASLRERTGARKPDEPTLSETVASVLTGMPEVWVPAERDELLARLKGPGAQIAAGALTTTPPASAPPSGGRPGEPSAAAASAPSAAEPTGTATSLSQVDQFVFEKALALEKAGKHFEAHEHAKPLYKKYPDDAAVQDLRCRTIMRTDAPPETMETECAPFARLSGLPGKR